MKVGLLFSGGKDSTLAGILAAGEHELVCLMSMLSSNPDSYMFHTPAMDIIDLQAEAFGYPLVVQGTTGIKEDELEDLSGLLVAARERYGIEGVVTGAVASTYQATRFQRVAYREGLMVFNPLWQMDQMELLEMVVNERIETTITGVAAYPLDQSWLGRSIDRDMMDELAALSGRWSINPAGEGGELETLVTTSPYHRGRLELTGIEPIMDSENSGRLIITGAEVVPH